MHNLLPTLWIFAFGYLFGLNRGQKSSCQPGTYLGQFLLIIIGLTILTFIFKVSFGIHWIFMR